MTMNRQWTLIAPVVLIAVVAVGLSACHRDPRAASQAAMQRAQQYVSADNYKAAIIEYRNAVQADPRNGDARYQLSIAYEKTRDTTNAFREAVRAADLLPERDDVQLRAINFLLLARRFEEARTRAQTVIARDPRNVQAQLALGSALAGLKDLEGAVAEIQQALAIDPERSGTYANLGALEAARGNMPAAEKAFKEAVTKAPTSPTVRVALAQFYWLSGRQADAEQVLKDALTLAPADPAVNRLMALLYEASNRHAEAEPFLKAAANAPHAADSKLALVDFYLASNRYAEASAILQPLRTDPAFATRAQLRAAEIERRQGRGDAALQLVADLLKREPRNVDVLLAHALLLQQKGDSAGALADANQAIAADPTSAPAQFVKGRVLVALRRPDDARQAFNETLRLNPRAAAAEVELARLQLQRGTPDTAVAFAGHAVKLDPRSAEAKLVFARALRARGDYTQAEGVLRGLVDAIPQSAAVHAEMGLLSAARKRSAEARAEFETAVKLEPLQLDAVGGLLALDLSENKRESARQRIDALVASASGNSAVLTMAAKTYLLLGDPTKVEPLLTRAIAADGNNLAAYGLLGQFYVTQKRLPDAQREFETLAQRQSPATMALTMVGILQQMRGQKAEAQKTFERVMSLDGHAAVAANNLAWLYCENGGNLDMALQLAQTAKAAMPEQAEVDDTLGWVYYRKDLLPLAITSLKSSVDHDPKNAVAQYHLGLAYVRAGDKTRAKGALQAALRLQPDFDGAADAARILATL
ncbi:MAG TPA: tetratricopeptide repeat protein [Vicinamibacterales bacterium]